MKKSTNVIYYPAGCYGTFVEWILNYFDGMESELPFTDHGSSHNYTGNLFFPPELLFQFLESNRNDKFVRCHPLIEQGIDIHEYQSTHSNFDISLNDLKFLQTNFNKVLVIHPTVDTYLWMENNLLQKCTITENIYDTWIEPYGHSKSIFSDSLGDKDVQSRIQEVISMELTDEHARQWGKERILDLDTWELRELISFYWFERINDSLICWEELKTIFSTVKFVSLENLNQFPHETIKSCLSFFNIVDYNIQNLDSIVDIWYSKQIHCNKDRDVNEVVESILQKKKLSWDEKHFNILEEALIQKKLSAAGLQLKCFDMNNFPTDTDSIWGFIET